MRILILSDSLALPRDLPEVCLYNETWPYLIKDSTHLIHQVSIGGATSKDLVKQAKYHKSFKPEIVICQTGIVDCAPRFLSKFEMAAILKLPFIGGKIITALNNNKFRSWRNFTYVSLKDFKSNLEKLEALFSCPVYFITIVLSNEEYNLILPGIKKNIDAYNNIIINNFHHINLQGLSRGAIMSDHHHINKNGHEFIAKNILKLLSNHK